MEKSDGRGRADKSSKTMISDALKMRLKETIVTIDGNGLRVMKTGAQAVADGLVDMALFSESEKIRAQCSKIVLEYTQGKPAVQTETVKEEIPIAAFELVSSEVEQVRTEASKCLPEPEDEEPRITVSIDGVEGEV